MILLGQNQMSIRHLVEIASCEKNRVTIGNENLKNAILTYLKEND